MVQDGISRRQVLDLANAKDTPAISIYVPTARKGIEVQQGRIRLKKLIGEAENLLVEQGMRRTLAIDLVSEATALVADDAFWNDRLDSIAIFISPERTECYHLSFTAPEFLEVSSQFFVRPLLGTMDRKVGFYVLALEKNHVRLLHCGPRGEAEVRVEHMPTNIQAFRQGHEAGHEAAQHSNANQAKAGTMGHTAGDKGLEETDCLKRFCTAVAHAVQHHIAPSNEPVILAGIEDVVSLFKSVSKIPHLVSDFISGSPKALSDKALHELADPIFNELRETERLAAIERYRAVAGTGLSTQQLEEVLSAASQGRVSELLTSNLAAVWGTFDDATLTVETHEEMQAGDHELVNQAAISTIEHCGVVYEIEPGELELVGAVAATFRY